jgi:ribosomal protein S18 acetylase RimI-like enzyme
MRVPDTSVRLAGRGDAVLLHLIAVATFPLAATPATPADDVAAYMDDELSVERFRSRLESDRRTLFISESEGTPAGYAMLNHSTAVPDDVRQVLQHSPSTELSKFYLLTGRHGSGRDAQLMEAVLDAAREREAASVWLTVNSENVRAQAFYDGYRFERRGTKVFTVGASVEDYLILEKAL